MLTSPEISNFKEITLCCSCKKEIIGYKSRPRKYCSQKCYKKAPKKERTEEHSNRLSVSNKKYYKNAEKEELENRWKNISKSRTINFTDEQIENIKKILEWGYVRDCKIILYHANINFGIKPIKRLIKENKEVKELYKKVLKFIPKFIQEWSFERFQEFIKDSETHDSSFIERKYKVKTKSFYTLGKKINIKWNNTKIINKKETKPERITRIILEDNNILYEREKCIADMKYRVDFIVGNNIIEVQGDYFHANPLIYDYSLLTKVQKENVIRDIKKKEWILNNGYKLLEVWEYDLYNNFEETKKKIIKYATE